MKQISDNRQNTSQYLIVAAESDHFSFGRWRLFQDLRRVEDTIEDDLLQWQQPAGTRGTLQLVRDQLPARDTWINTTWLGWSYKPSPGLELTSKLKWQLYHQLDDDLDLRLRGIRQDGSFLGLINKAEYSVELGKWTFVPRWKSEFRRESPVEAIAPKRRELTELFMAMLRFPLLQSSFVEWGLEYELFKQLRDVPPAGSVDSFTGITSAVQLRNASAYQGYNLMTTVGFEIRRRNPQGLQAEVTTRSFITIYAGVDL